MPTSSRRVVVPLLCLAAVAAFARDADAWEIDSFVTTRCHERITEQAIRTVGWPDGRSPDPPSATDRRVLDDLPFSLPEDLEDPWHLALMLGVRHNDVGGEDPSDLAALVSIHNDPSKQDEHCLRRRTDDYAPGDTSALEACRAFILSQLEQALGADDAIDFGATTTVETWLAFRGRVDLELRRYAFHLGKALHALQDAYTHQFRDPGDARVTHVLNWIEGNVGDDYVIARDGHRHLSSMDDCASGTPSAERREAWAIAASAALIAALADEMGGRAARLERARQVLDASFALRDGCTRDNDWCDAPDAAPGAGCAVVTSASGLGAGGAVLLVALWLRRRGARARTRRRGALARAKRRGLAVALAACCLPALAAAQVAETEGGREPDEGGQLEQQERRIAAEPERVEATWGAALSGGASLDRGGGMVSAGVRWNPFDAVGFGLDVEYNPWLSATNLDVSPGAASIYVPVTWQLKRFGSWELRSTFYAGATMQLAELVGVDSGSVGPFVGWNPLGIAIPYRDFKLVIKPGDIAVPIPQVSGIPFYYHQYRMTVSVEWFP